MFEGYLLNLPNIKSSPAQAEVVRWGWDGVSTFMSIQVVEACPASWTLKSVELGWPGRPTVSVTGSCRMSCWWVAGLYFVDLPLTFSSCILKWQGNEWNWIMILLCTLPTLQDPIGVLLVFVQIFEDAWGLHSWSHCVLLCCAFWVGASPGPWLEHAGVWTWSSFVTVASLCATSSAILKFDSGLVHWRCRQVVGWHVRTGSRFTCETVVIKKAT